MVGYWLAGLWVPAVTHYYLLSLPVLLPAVWLGKVVNHRLHGDAFLKNVYVGLAVIGVVLLAGCKSLPPPMPLEQLNGQQMHGHAVFQAHCASCHYDRKDKPLHGPPLLGVFKQPTLQSGAPANDERVTATILHGHGLMPAVGNNMDQQDIDDLLAYLHTL